MQRCERFQYPWKVNAHDDESERWFHDSLNKRASATRNNAPFRFCSNRTTTHLLTLRSLKRMSRLDHHHGRDGWHILDHLINLNDSSVAMPREQQQVVQKVVWVALLRVATNRGTNTADGEVRREKLSGSWWLDWKVASEDDKLQHVWRWSIEDQHLYIQALRKVPSLRRTRKKSNRRIKPWLCLFSALLVTIGWNPYCKSKVWWTSWVLASTMATCTDISFCVVHHQTASLNVTGKDFYT
jgi:hypothetical protein